MSGYDIQTAEIKTVLSSIVEIPSFSLQSVIFRLSDPVALWQYRHCDWIISGQSCSVYRAKFVMIRLVAYVVLLQKSINIGKTVNNIVVTQIA